MVLCRTVFNSRGDILLRQGTVLSERYLDILRTRGYTSVLVADPDTEDIVISDILSERVRAAVTSEVAQLYGGVWGEEDTKKVAEMMSRLRANIVDMVEEVMEGETMISLQAMRAQDTYLFDHSIDGTIVALLIGRRLGYDRSALQRLAAGSIGRDIGMMKVPLEIREKTTALTPEEWTLVRQHTELGFLILRKARPGSVIPNAVALQHHERQDGLGYPQGLWGTNKISREPVGPGRLILDAEITAVADVYDALGADRPHRPALSSERVAVELLRLAGGHLNRAIVEQLLWILPLFPIGSEILLRTGPYQGYRGVVVAVSAEDLARPVVRVLYNRGGMRIPPFEIDLRKDPSTLAGISLRSNTRT